MDGQTTIIKIASVSRQIKESKMGTGPYSLTEITDAKTGLKAATFGAWAEGWKEGDEVEVKWEKNAYTDRNGVSRESWKLKNPNAKAAPSYSAPAAGASENIIIAAALVGAQYANVQLTPRIAKEAADKVKKIAAVLSAETAPVAPAPTPAPAYVPPPAPAYVPPAPAPEPVYVPPPMPVAPTPVAPSPVVDTEFEEDDKPF